MEVALEHPSHFDLDNSSLERVHDSEVHGGTTFCNEPKEGHMEAFLLKNLDIPPELMGLYSLIREKAGRLSAKDLVKLKEDLLLRIHFPGESVVCRHTREGTQVVAHGFPETNIVKNALDAMPLDERKKVYTVYPESLEHDLDFVAPKSR